MSESSPRIFSKPYLSVIAQIQLLQQRGLIVRNLDLAKHYLKHIGYYRYTGYMRAFQQGQNHQFIPNTSFEDILELYIFDRKLRVLIIDAIERIEVALRSILTNTMALNDTHWYQDDRYFKNSSIHSNILENIKNDIGYDKPQRRDNYIKHYYSNYDLPDMPPSWMVFESVSFGILSMIYKELCTEYRKQISSHFGSIHHDVLRTWFHALTYLRNLCAHHSRVWNRTFSIKPKLPKRNPEFVGIRNDRFYVFALIIKYLLKSIAPDSLWFERLKELLANYSKINPQKMGFPVSL